MRVYAVAEHALGGCANTEIALGETAGFWAWRRAREPPRRRASPSTLPSTAPSIPVETDEDRGLDRAGVSHIAGEQGRAGHATLGRPWGILRPPWQPGESGNLRGPTGGLFQMAAEIRRRTGNGSDVGDVSHGRGGGEADSAGGGRVQHPRLEHRLDAAQWLADRGWGKAKEIIELKDESVTTPEQRLALLRRLTDEERATLRAILAKALGTADGDGGANGAGESSESGASNLGEPVTPDPVDPVRPAPDPRGSGAPEQHAQPRNVGRAITRELGARDDAVPVEGDIGTDTDDAGPDDDTAEDDVDATLDHADPGVDDPRPH